MDCVRTMRTVNIFVILLILICHVHTQAQGMNAIYRKFYQPTHVEAEGQRDEDAAAMTHNHRWKPLSAGWGMPDATAHVGKVFRYAIPSDAFRGDIIKYKVIEADSPDLPPWLYYDEDSSAVEGIPSDADIGQYYISVTAVGHKSNSTTPTEISDVFSINVGPGDQTRLNGEAPVKEDNQDTVCSKDKLPAIASIILDADWSTLSSKERVDIVLKMAHYSMLKVGAFRLLPKGRKSTLDEKILVTGPGNVPERQFKGVSLSWKIGCGEDAANLPVVSILETAAKDNSMAKEFGHNIIGWQVTGQKNKIKLRVRRQVHLFGTPMPTPVPSAKPTFTVEPSVVPTIVPTMQPTLTVKPTMTSSPPMPSVTPTKSLSLTPVMTSAPIISTVSTIMQPTLTVKPTMTSSSPMPSVTPTESLSLTPVMTSTPIIPTVSTIIQPTMVATPIATPTETIPSPTPPVDKPPFINRQINRIDALEGVPLVFVIPADTFLDEDGDARDLFLDVIENGGMKLNDKSWLKFHKQKQMLYGLPPAIFPDGRDRRSYFLGAQDHRGQPRTMPFEVVITKVGDQNDIPAPPVTMGAAFDIDFDDFVNDVELQLEILNRIASVYGDGDASAITITGLKRGSVILSWTNNTIDKNSCPAEQIAEIMSKLVNPDGTPTQELIDAFAPEYNISGVEAMEAGPCVATTTVPTTVPTLKEEKPTNGGGQLTTDDAWSGLVPALVIVFIILLAGIIVLLLYRKHRKGKLSDEDNDTFINKGIPIILPDEVEGSNKPPANSSSPLIMSTEKPPLPPPEYHTVQEGAREPLLLNGNDNHKVNSDDDDKNSLPLTDVSGSPPYQKPDPPSSTPAEGRKQAPVNTPGYRVPPPYVPP